MDRMCPYCGAKHFYVKDPEDQYNIFNFSLADGAIEYSDTAAGADNIQLSEDTEIFCEKCAWHDKMKTLKQAG